MIIYIFCIYQKIALQPVGQNQKEESRVETLEREIMELKAQMLKAEEERYMASLSVVKKGKVKKRRSKSNTTLRRKDILNKQMEGGESVSITSLRIGAYPSFVIIILVYDHFN
jgi:hypothetical protein